jgi:hypothetical protein
MWYGREEGLGGGIMGGEWFHEYGSVDKNWSMCVGMRFFVELG